MIHKTESEIMQNWRSFPENGVVVSIRCFTFNHQNYIEKCLDSLLMQQTDFPFRIVVHDDASTDGTAGIVKEYQRSFPNIIIAVVEGSNLYSRDDGTLQHAVDRYITGKYVAICEGDDFWVDDRKLQKQVDFLERENDYVACGHAAYYADESGRLMEDRFFNYGKGSREIKTEDIITDWVMATNSLVYKNECVPNNEIPYLQKARNRDFALISFLTLQGKFYYFDERMSAYRVVSTNSVMDQCRNNFAFRIDMNSRFVEMLYSMDEYTKGKFHKLIEKRARNMTYASCYDIIINRPKEHYRSVYKYNKLTFIEKLKLLKLKLKCVLYPERVM